MFHLIKLIEPPMCLFNFLTCSQRVSPPNAHIEVCLQVLDMYRICEEAVCYWRNCLLWCLSCIVGNAGTQNNTAGQFKKNWSKSTYRPQCNFAAEWHHWRQFTRSHAASSGAPKGFILLYWHMQSYSNNCKHTIIRTIIGGVTLKCNNLNS